MVDNEHTLAQYAFYSTFMSEWLHKEYKRQRLAKPLDVNVACNEVAHLLELCAGSDLSKIGSQCQDRQSVGHLE